MKSVIVLRCRRQESYFEGKVKFHAYLIWYNIKVLTSVERQMN